MDIRIEAVDADRYEEYVRAVFVTFGASPTQQDLEDTRIEYEPGRSMAAFDEDRIVGTASMLSLQMTVPGGAQVATAGLTTVGVQPTHRRRGILRALMRRQLDDSHERGDPFTALWASEPAIYQRYGYGMATRQASFRVPRTHTAFARPAPDQGRVRLIGLDEAPAEMGPVYDRALAGTPGMLTRTGEWWIARFRHLDAEHHREGFGPMFYALHEGPDGPDAYAAYRVKMHEEDGIDAGQVQVVEAVTTTPESVAGIWSFVFGIDLVETIETWNRPPDDPLFLQLLDPRRLRLSTVDGLWARVLDVPAALSARSYPTEGRVVLEVRDEFCPWNEGRYLLEGGPDGAECRSTDGEPDVALTANELGAAYLGGTRLRDLARAGRVEELTAGALDLADRMFAGDREPWCPHQF